MKGVLDILSLRPELTTEGFRRPRVGIFETYNGDTLFYVGGPGV